MICQIMRYVSQLCRGKGEKIMKQKESIEEKKIRKRIGQVLYDNQGDMTREQYAKFLKITPTSLSNYQDDRLPKLEQLINIKTALNLPYDYLLGEMDVTNYSHIGIDKSLGLSNSCIRKLEELNKINSSFSLSAISLLIEKCPIEVWELLGKFLSMPLLKKEFEINDNKFKNHIGLFELNYLEKEDNAIREYFYKEFSKAFDVEKADKDINSLLDDDNIIHFRQELTNKVNDVFLISMKEFIDKNKNN